MGRVASPSFTQVTLTPVLSVEYVDKAYKRGAGVTSGVTSGFAQHTQALPSVDGRGPEWPQHGLHVQKHCPQWFSGGVFAEEQSRLADV